MRLRSCRQESRRHRNHQTRRRRRAARNSCRNHTWKSHRGPIWSGWIGESEQRPGLPAALQRTCTTLVLATILSMTFPNSSCHPKVALVAEIEEDWTTPVDIRMEAIEGLVFRRALSEVKHQVHEENVNSMKADMAQFKAEQG